MKNKLPYIYFIVLILEIFAGELGFQNLVYVLKPCLMILLIIWVVMENPQKHILFITALLFSLLGDVLLMFNNSNLFIFGLGSFLITHLIYIAVFYKNAKFNWESLLGFISLVALFYVVIIDPKVPKDLKIPVTLYTIVIVGMVTTLRAVKTLNSKPNLLTLGATLFMISDLIIAINKFSFSIPYPTLLIMSTYGIGQFLITKGYLKLSN